MLLRDVRPGRPTAVRYRPPYPPAVPVELPLPEFDAVARATATVTSTGPHDGTPLLVAVADHPASARPPSVLDTLVDLALVETTQPSSSSPLDLLPSHEGETGGSPSRALTAALPPLSHSWVQVLLGDPVDTAASGSTTPRLLADPPIVRCPTPVILSPAAAVEAAFAPPPTDIVEVTTSTEALPRVATGFDPMMSEAADAGPLLSTDRLLPSEDELGNIFTSSKDNSIAGPARVPPRPNGDENQAHSSAT